MQGKSIESFVPLAVIYAEVGFPNEKVLFTTFQNTGSQQWPNKENYFSLRLKNNFDC